MTETKCALPSTTQEVSIFLELYRKVCSMKNDDYKYISGLIDGYRLAEEKIGEHNAEQTA